jgi:hypothetical protein
VHHDLGGALVLGVRRDIKSEVSGGAAGTPGNVDESGLHLSGETVDTRIQVLDTRISLGREELEGIERLAWKI